MSSFELTDANLTLTQLLYLQPSTLLDRYDKYMYLKLYVDDTNLTNELKKIYIDTVLDHNKTTLDPNNLYLDAGFDIFNPTKQIFNVSQISKVNKIDHNIICSAKMLTRTNSWYTGYYMYPRSSISKTKLRLANSIGIIDSGYRGHLMGMFDLINLDENDEYVVEKYDRLLQICAPDLAPIVVEVVNTMEELGIQTERGDGGFGSTGR